MKLDSTFLFVALTLFSMPVRTPAQDMAPKPRHTAPKEQSPEQQLQPMLSECRRRIHRHLENLTFKPFVCTFNFDSNSQVCAIKIIKTSGSSTFDQAVIDAIKTSNLHATEPRDDRRSLVQTRGLRLEIFDKPYPDLQVNLGSEYKNAGYGSGKGAGYGGGDFGSNKLKFVPGQGMTKDQRLAPEQ